MFVKGLKEGPLKGPLTIQGVCKGYLVLRFREIPYNPIQPHKTHKTLIHPMPHKTLFTLEHPPKRNTVDDTLGTPNYGIVVHSLSWVMQDLYHQPYIL